MKLMLFSRDLKRSLDFCWHSDITSAYKRRIYHRWTSVDKPSHQTYAKLHHPSYTLNFLLPHAVEKFHATSPVHLLFYLRTKSSITDSEIYMHIRSFGPTTRLVFSKYKRWRRPLKQPFVSQWPARGLTLPLIWILEVSTPDPFY